MKPMLAKKYQDHHKKLVYPLFVQPKLNGVRALYNNQEFQSRDEHFWSHNCLISQRQKLKSIDSRIILDGELYCHGWSLQRINSAISVNRISPHQNESKIKYHVFDLFYPSAPEAPFRQRSILLHQLQFYDNITLVPTYRVDSPSEADHYFGQFLDEGYEGMMYRQDVEYGVEWKCGNKENRWDCLLKRKDWLDEDCECVDVNEGTGKYSDSVGSLVLRFPGNGLLFSAGSGLSDMQRRRYRDEPPVGCMVKVKYEMLSDSGVPLKPTIEAVLDEIRKCPKCNGPLPTASGCHHCGYPGFIER